MQHTITQKTTALEALSQCAPESTRNTLRGWIHDRRVQINGKEVTTASFEVHPGDSLVVTDKPKKKQGPLRILFEDNHVVVIDKPSGLLSVATNFTSHNTAHAHLKNKFRPRKVFVIHRLDQETSGVMMFALSEKAYENLKAKLKTHDVGRIYYGLVEGRLEGKGSWTNYLVEDKNYVVRVSTNKDEGEKAVTHYEAVQHGKDVTLVRFQLETGKKNQIRVQAATNGHPLFGDTKYGGEKAQRLFLHAEKLYFHHPITEKLVTFDSRYQKSFCVNCNNCL